METPPNYEILHMQLLFNLNCALVGKTRKERAMYLERPICLDVYLQIDSYSVVMHILLLHSLVKLVFYSCKALVISWRKLKYFEGARVEILRS